MVKVFLHNHPQNVLQEELEQDLLLLPQWRLTEVMKYRQMIDRVLATKAYLLLCKGLRELYGITESPVFSYLAHGKPVLRDYPNIHFNLSHCHKGVLCVLSDRPVGCDIEEIPSCIDFDLYSYCFSEDENKIIHSDETPTIAFTKLWTQKEALLKLTGDGLNDHLKTVLSTEVSRTVEFSTVVQSEYGFIYTICQ